MPIVTAVAGPHAPQLLATPDTSNAEMIKTVHESMGQCKEHMRAHNLDVVVCIGNDHLRGFFFDAMPPIAIYTGQTAEGAFGPGKTHRYKVDTDLAYQVLKECIDSGFDLTFSQSLKLDYAFFIPLGFMMPSNDIPVVPLFVNAYVPPQPTPKRAYAWGQKVAEILNARPERIGIVASGGLSHYPATPRYANPDFTFDRWVLDLLEKGKGSELTKLTPEELDAAGNIELLPWIVLLGMIGDAPAEVLTYQPEWHHGYGVIRWDLPQRAAA